MFRDSDELENRLLKAETDLNTFQIIPIDYHIAKTAAKIDAELTRMGKHIVMADIMIAATTLCNDLIIISRNVNHFSRISGLKIESY